MIDLESKASFVTVCLNGKDCSVRLILVYGPQENDSEDKDSFYHDISSEQLFELCNKYNLKVMNASEHCEGVLTRIHKCKQTAEKSVLDYVLSHQTWKSTLLPWKLMRKSILHHGIALNMVKDIPTILLLSFA